ncbi:MAG: gamma-glutamylcyclotransferase family protein [Ginsengibacter sp.]
MNDRDYLFVYGTLRNAYDLKLKEQVAKDLQYIGRAKVGGSLYDLGKYPGAIKENNKNEVIGDVFLIDNPDRTFKILDKYEGDKFTRNKNRIRLRSGKLIDAWVYWYNQKPSEKQKIRHKDYLNYLKSKKKKHN